MQSKRETNHPILRDYGNGLILRRGTPSDAEALGEFNARIHSEREDKEPDFRVKAWTRDLLETPHPTFSPGDFTLVEERKTGKIVSSMNLISQTWSYGGIPFRVGRPELVGTDPDYRKRGLVRDQFEVVHQWSVARGEKMQAITGIPYYYRQFGYEMGLELDGGRAGYQPNVPQLKDGQEEPYRLRPARRDDLTFIDSLARTGSQRSLVSCLWDEALWEYELNGKSEDNATRVELRIIEAGDGQRAGFLIHPAFLWRNNMQNLLAATGFEVTPGTSWAAVTPPVVRYLYATGEAYAAQGKFEHGSGGPADFGSFGFWLGSEHPVYQVMNSGLPRKRVPYAWYVRVPDLPGFLRHIAPFLEQRLASSPLSGHSGELKITFYRTGLRMQFDHGRIAAVEAWQPEPFGHSGTAAFPDLTFLQLLFGYRSLEELYTAWADCWYENDEVFALLNALFPKQASHVWPAA